LEWIKCLRNAWLHTVSEQNESQKRSLITAEKPHRSASVVSKPKTRRVIRRTVPFINHPMNKTITEQKSDEPKDNSDHQKFIGWRSSAKNNNSSQFQLYILPVRV
jgi:hypothetical protein